MSEGPNRVHALVEGLTRGAGAKDTGLARWRSHSFAINTACVTAVAIAIDLLCWTRRLLLDGRLAKVEPYCRCQPRRRHRLTRGPPCPFDPKQGLASLTKTKVEINVDRKQSSEKIELP